MSDWQVINIGVSNNAWNVASAELIAEYLGGEMQMAYADLGIESITISYWYISQTYDTTQTDIPLVTWSGCPYALFGAAIGGYYGTTCKFPIVTIAQASTWVATIGGGDGGCSGTWNVFEGDGFTALKQMNNSSCFLVKDTANDLVNGGTVNAIVGNGILFDVDNGVIVDTSVVKSNVYSQNDGQTFTEVVNEMLVDSTGGSGSHVYNAEHVYKYLFDYDSGRDKNILINGVKMNRMVSSNYYIPLE